ncbi:unnamed protein product, partial [Musa acuminata subsp. burmannicoides]
NLLGAALTSPSPAPSPLSDFDNEILMFLDPEDPNFPLPSRSPTTSLSESPSVISPASIHLAPLLAIFTPPNPFKFLSFVVSSDVRQRRFSSSPVNKSSAAPLLTRKPLQVTVNNLIAFSNPSFSSGGPLQCCRNFCMLGLAEVRGSGLASLKFKSVFLFSRDVGTCPSLVLRTNQLSLFTGGEVCCGSGCCMNTGFDFIRLHQVRPVSDMKAIT